MRSIIISSIFMACCLQLQAQADIQRRLQNDFIQAEDGDTIFIEAGFHQLNASLWLDGKKNITIKGAGKDKTILSFKDQSQGAEGIKVTDAEQICIRDLSVQDSKGDAIKTQKVKGIQFINISTVWTGKIKKTNGAYGLYPVQCEQVLIDGCRARGASDAGIYVGQSKYIVVRNCLAEENVAGIEIENSLYADVYNNKAINNTGGILVFDLPDLLLKKGGYVRVFNNDIQHNNHRNFAPKGNIVAKVPLGTGILILATSNVEVFDNTIHYNRTMGLGVMSYFITENPIKDEAYDPYPSQIYIHNNHFLRKKRRTTIRGRMGKLFWFKLKFGRKVPHILWDGIVKEKNLRQIICVQNNENVSFSNIDAQQNFKNKSSDLSIHRCAAPILKPVEIPEQ